MHEITIKLDRPRVNDLLQRYQHDIGEDLPGYRNHVYRAITYAMHFLGDDMQFEKLVETAFVYHDIGLWTNNELAYLEPSETIALRDNVQYGWNLDPMALKGAIHWHHKVFPYRGPHEVVIEACRKADWIDASKGGLRKGISRKAVMEVESAFPNLGFHKTLLRLTKDIGGSTFVGGARVILGIVKW